MWSIISLIIIGLIAGALARLIMPGKQDLSWLGTIVLGVLGAFVGGTLGALIFEHKLAVQTPQAHTFIGAIIGSLILLFIYERFMHRGRSGHTVH